MDNGKKYKGWLTIILPTKGQAKAKARPWCLYIHTKEWKFKFKKSLKK